MEERAMPRRLWREFSFHKPYKASEAPSQRECDEFMIDSEVDKSKKFTGMEHKSIRGFFPKRV